jgi:hypothetical protein
VPLYFIQKNKIKIKIMGFDIYGRKPKITTEKPAAIDYKTANDDEKKKYWQAISKWEDENPGYYIRYNCWGWRPILHLALVAIEYNNLKFNTNFWDSNDGRGLRTQKQCDRLADCMSKWVTVIEEDLKRPHWIKEDEDDDEFIFNLDSWSRHDHKQMTDDENKMLSEKFKYGQYMGTSVVINNVKYDASYTTSVEEINRFITFLRECGGFKIW